MADGGTAVVAGEVVAEGEGSSRISEIPQKSHDEAGSLSLCGKIPTATFLPSQRESKTLGCSNHRNEISERAEGAS